MTPAVTDPTLTVFACDGVRDGRFTVEELYISPVAAADVSAGPMFARSTTATRGRAPDDDAPPSWASAVKVRSTDDSPPAGTARDRT